MSRPCERTAFEDLRSFGRAPLTGELARAMQRQFPDAKPGDRSHFDGGPLGVLTVEWLTARWGGRYPLWRCFCGRRVRLVYVDTRRVGTWCRHCLRDSSGRRLIYRSQQNGAEMRAQMRGDKVARQLGSPDGYGPAEKPRGMWWRTFNRGLERIEHFESQRIERLEERVSGTRFGERLASLSANT